jgi:hypothetical protein
MNWFVAYAKTKNEFKALDFLKKLVLMLMFRPI